MSDDPTTKEPSAQTGIEPRRLPVQARSRERVDRILDAAARLLTEQGYDAVKTNHIAREAEVSIGSIYQFFPNKYAIFHALAVRYLDRVAEILSSHLRDAPPDRSWQEVIDGVIDELAGMWRAEPAFLAVWMAIQNTAELRESNEHYSQIFLNEDLMSFLTRFLPHIHGGRRRAIGRTVFEVSQRLLDLSMQPGPGQDPMVIDELKRLLRSYLTSHIEIHSRRSV